MQFKNLKPFDLERALAGDPVIRRDGRKVLEIKFFDKICIDYPLCCLIENEGNLCVYRINGTCYMGDRLGMTSPYDLFMADLREIEMKKTTNFTLNDIDEIEKYLTKINNYLRDIIEHLKLSSYNKNFDKFEEGMQEGKINAYQEILVMLNFDIKKGK